MSRRIDKLPAPADKRRMKVVIPSPSRSGTLGLYGAMKILGYKPYHMVEVVLQGGEPHMRLFEEAAIAEYNRFSGTKRYNKADIQKWVGEYDCLIEIPSYLGTTAIDAYLDDPDVKFILTERDPDKWVKSYNGSVATIVTAAQSFPMSVLKHFNPFLNAFLYLNEVLYWVVSDGTNPGDPHNEAAMRRNYVEYIKLVKERVPADRMKVIKLEDGLGWDDICPFLGKPIPNEVYPRGNEAKDFEKRAKGLMGELMKQAAMKFAATVVPAIGVGTWATMRYGPAFFAAVRQRLS